MAVVVRVLCLLKVAGSVYAARALMRIQAYQDTTTYSSVYCSIYVFLLYRTNMDYNDNILPIFG